MSIGGKERIFGNGWIKGKFGQYFRLVNRLKPSKGIAEISGFHERIGGLILDELFGGIYVIILGLLIFIVIELDAIFFLWA